MLSRREEQRVDAALGIVVRALVLGASTGEVDAFAQPVGPGAAATVVLARRYGALRRSLAAISSNGGDRSWRRLGRYWVAVTRGLSAEILAVRFGRCRWGDPCLNRFVHALPVLPLPDTSDVPLRDPEPSGEHMLRVGGGADFSNLGRSQFCSAPASAVLSVGHGL